MKKLDKLFIKSFLGPFILTLSIVLFILIIQFYINYINELLGKNLGNDVFIKLTAYQILMSIPRAMPLAVLLATLMTFGNLGEHTEITAMKASGIPLWRIMLPIFSFTVMLTIGSYFYNDKVSPWANLKGFSLLYDVKTTKAAFNIEEGIFYNQIPGYRIKVQKKYADNISLKNIIVYDHTGSSGNKNLTIADSGRM
ncbi:MAG: LptF/LptG family permease, partial [Leadbetterella sp.]